MYIRRDWYNLGNDLSQYLYAGIISASIAVRLLTSLGKLLLQSLQVKMFDQSPMRHDPAPVEARASDLAPVHGGSSTAEISSSSQALDAPHHTAVLPTHPSIKARASDLAPVHGGSIISSQALDAPDHAAGPPSPPAPVHGSFLVIQTIYLLFVQRGDNGQWQ